jgi:TonB family protein
MRFVGGIFLSILFLGPNVYGQIIPNPDPDFEPAKIITTPRLTVPKEAIDSGLGGVVRVLVSIDEDGNVTSADNVNGPGTVCPSVTRTDVVAMRDAAKEAALLAKFSPATKRGKPQKSTLWLNFTYPGKKEESNFSAGPVVAVKGETDKSQLPKQINGGVVNGKALSLPKPPYPAAAHAVRASGAVSIQVLIDESGEVFSAQAVSGHPLLRAAAAIAACSAKFTPTTLQGNLVKVSGVITYNFVP